MRKNTPEEAAAAVERGRVRSREAMRRKRAADPTYNAKICTAYYRRHGGMEKVAEYRKRPGVVERLREASRKAYWKNHAISIERDRLRYQKNGKEKARKRRREKPDAVNAANKAWRVRNPERVRDADRSKHANRRGAVGKVRRARRPVLLVFY